VRGTVEQGEVGDDHPDEHGDGTAIVHVGDAFDLGRLTVGETVELCVSAGAGGTFDLVSLDDHSGPGRGGDDGDHSGPGGGGDD
jgi:hypothetical protein